MGARYSASVQNGLGTIQASYTMGTVSLSWGVKRPGRGLDHPTPSSDEVNLLKPNDIYIYICRTAALTSKRYILNIYSTNIHTEYFKHAAQSPFFSLRNAVYFIMLPFLVRVLFAFYYRVC